MNDTTHDAHDHRELLKQIATKAMVDYGLLPEFSREAMGEADRARPAGGGAADAPGAASGSAPVRDLRDRLWCSIDNDDSRDLDQLSVSEPLPNGSVRILIAIADVDALVAAGSAIDAHARQNTTSVYTPAEIFPMLPERLSTDLTSLAFGEERCAMVADLVIDSQGLTTEATVYRGLVVNRAKLAYNSVAAWLETQGPMPEAMAAVPGMADQVRAQDAVAQRLRKSRLERGALDFQTIETRPVFDGNAVRELAVDRDNRAHNLIEDFMIAANSATVQFLEAKGFPSIRRVVKSPERWDRLEALAATFGVHLPADPDSRALADFLAARRAADPVRFPDLSLSVIKLLGAGEYVVDRPHQEGEGHFGLAVKDYTHSTAPNRRFPDLITQRLLKAALAGRPPPYERGELTALAKHCTEQEGNAAKVERQVLKSAAALLLARRTGERFDAIVTGASDKGTWVRIFQPPVEGKVVRGFEGLDVGDRVRVELVHTDVQRGFIDFARAREGA
jgi:VacB/RNase II family 3'-5' exoribonuclease